MTSLQLKEQISTQFLFAETNKNGNHATGLEDVRKKFFDDFKQHGFPHRKDEEWKYVNLESVLKHPYQLPITAENYIKKSDNRLNDLLSNFQDCLVFINGRFSPDFSIGSVYTPFLKIFPKKTEVENKYFLNHFTNIISANDSFISINTALAEKFYFIDIPPGFSNPSPLFIIHVTDSESGAIMNNSRFLIHAGKNAVVQVVEYFIQEGTNPGLSNRVAEIHCEEDSILHHNLIQDSSIQNNTDTNLIINSGIRIERNASLSSVALILSGSFTRNNLKTCLSGERANANLYGLYLLSGEQFADNHTLVDHAVPLCTSDELYKGVLNDSSKGVFNGKIVVRKDAQKTVAYQSNKNLLLSQDATIYTKPQLEIFADDVKCSHGATSGQLDEDALFYLRSRGINKTESINLLVTAFAREIINKIQFVPLRELIEKRLEIV
ncbi:MAG: Fe-S cluster assembly protein SufD [Bacteroidetes bacterium RIFCSPLOWO2_12_FULL_37_12]|nr:MAG: Fe-S cluster assembly protein SufD [Bacteroidetes bacterium RIFCSPLOWO2_12_FULL_37_12]